MLGFVAAVAWIVIAVIALVAVVWAARRAALARRTVEYVVLVFFCGLSAGIIGKLKGSSFFIWFLSGSCCR